MCDATHGFARERNALFFAEQSAEPFTDADDLPPPSNRRENRGADDSVETGRITTAGRNCDFHNFGTWFSEAV